jgi:hypothetical protein
MNTVKIKVKKFKKKSSKKYEKLLLFYKKWLKTHTLLHAMESNIKKTKSQKTKVPFSCKRENNDDFYKKRNNK